MLCKHGLFQRYALNWRSGLQTAKMLLILHLCFKTHLSEPCALPELRLRGGGGWNHGREMWRARLSHGRCQWGAVDPLLKWDETDFSIGPLGEVQVKRGGLGLGQDDGPLPIFSFHTSKISSWFRPQSPTEHLNSRNSLHADLWPLPTVHGDYVIATDGHAEVYCWWLQRGVAGGKEALLLPGRQTLHVLLPN